MLSRRYKISYKNRKDGARTERIDLYLGINGTQNHNELKLHPDENQKIVVFSGRQGTNIISTDLLRQRTVRKLESEGSYQKRHVELRERYEAKHQTIRQNNTQRPEHLIATDTLATNF